MVGLHAITVFSGMGLLPRMGILPLPTLFGFTLIRIMAELGAIKRQKHCNFEQ